MNKIIIYSLIGLIVVGVGGFAVYKMTHGGQKQNESVATTRSDTGSGQTQSSTKQSNTTVSWNESGNGWVANGTPPSCPDLLNLKTPIDLTKATAVLYPGQVRGGDYKAHGGFLFKNSKNDDITVTAPLDAAVYRGSRYNEAGEVQYLFDFIAPCGILYRLDHLRTLSPAFQQIANSFPEPSESSRTTNLSTPVTVKAGDPVATSVGFVKTNNVSVDWGVYDLRAKNTASQDSSWASQHSNNSLASYAVCWLNDLSSADSAIAKALPAGDMQSGKTSDFCK
jgi:hypothetical protein